MSYKVYDSLVHPECDKQSFQQLKDSMRSNGIERAFAVSLPKQINLDHQKYFDLSKEVLDLTPVAAVCSDNNPEDELQKIYDIGYRHVKVHPRLLDKTLERDFDYYNRIFSWAALHGVVIFLCTYNSWSINKFPEQDPLIVLGRLIKYNPTGKYVLLHGGSSNILKYYEHFRNIENVFLDVSYTLMQFFKSSLLGDMKFIANNFDRRFLVGSDYPEFTHQEFIPALSELVSGLPPEKIDNIFRNNWIKVRDGNFHD